MYKFLRYAYTNNKGYMQIIYKYEVVSEHSQAIRKQKYYIAPVKMFHLLFKFWLYSNAASRLNQVSKARVQTCHNMTHVQGLAHSITGFNLVRELMDMFMNFCPKCSISWTNMWPVLKLTNVCQKPKQVWYQVSW